MPPFYFIGIFISIAYFFQKTHKIKPERSVWIGCDFLGKEKGKKEKREKKENHSRRTRERQTGGTALCLLRGMGIAFAITCIIFIGFGMILTYTAASEESAKGNGGCSGGLWQGLFTPLCFTLLQALRRIPSFCMLRG